MHPAEGPGRGLSEMPSEDPVLEPELESIAEDGAETPVVETDPIAEVPQQIVTENVSEDIEVEEPARAAERAQHEQDMEFNRATFDPVRIGRANDGVVYVNLKGNKVRLDIRAREFPCDLDGVRTSRKSARPEGMDPEMWNVLRPHRAAQAKKAAKALKLEPQPQVAPSEDKPAKKEEAPDAGGSSSSKPPSPRASTPATCTSLALGAISLAASGAIPLVDLIARFDPRVIIDDGVSSRCKLVQAMVVQEQGCPAIRAVDEMYDFYDEFAHQVFVAHEMEDAGRQRVLQDIRRQAQLALVATTEIPIVPSAKAKAKAKSLSVVPKSKAAAKTKATAKAKAQPPVRHICERCHTTWTIDDMDRDFHVTAAIWERFGCPIYRPETVSDDSSPYESDFQGRSLSEDD
jgi:hypothetical protein